MRRARFYVVHHEGSWAVRRDREYQGPFATQQAAIDHAVTAALYANEYGVAAQIFLHGGTGRYRTMRRERRLRGFGTALRSASEDLLQVARLLLQPR